LGSGAGATACRQEGVFQTGEEGLQSYVLRGRKGNSSPLPLQNPFTNIYGGLRGKKNRVSGRRMTRAFDDRAKFKLNLPSLPLRCGKIYVIGTRNGVGWGVFPTRVRVMLELGLLLSLLRWVVAVAIDVVFPSICVVEIRRVLR
jgi:hypothetical protein